MRMRLLHLIPMGSLLALVACAGSAPGSSLAAGVLAPCPPRPNCVSTHRAEPPGRRVEPVPFTGTVDDAQRRIRRALEAEPRTTIVEERRGYLRAAARSRLFGFVDDVEVVIDSAESVAHLRSAARLGRSDLGVNRARVERLTALLRAP